MSFKLWLNGQKRKAARRGLGRGAGAIHELLKAQERETKREARRKKQHEVNATSELKSLLKVAIAHDQKRGKSKRRASKRA